MHFLEGSVGFFSISAKADRVLPSGLSGPNIDPNMLEAVQFP